MNGEPDATVRIARRISSGSASLLSYPEAPAAIAAMTAAFVALADRTSARSPL